MSVVSHPNSIATGTPSSFDFARRDDFFGFGNPMQAIDSITPAYTSSDGGIQQPVQVVTKVSSGALPSNLAQALAPGGSFFDLRPPSEIFAEMDARLTQQRQQALNSPEMMKMLQEPPPQHHHQQ